MLRVAGGVITAAPSPAVAFSANGAVHQVRGKQEASVETSLAEQVACRHKWAFRTLLRCEAFVKLKYRIHIT